jgi:hypothetical protein
MGTGPLGRDRRLFDLTTWLLYSGHEEDPASAPWSTSQNLAHHQPQPLLPKTDSKADGVDSQWRLNCSHGLGSQHVGANTGKDNTRRT